MKNLSEIARNDCPDCGAEPGDLHEAGCTLVVCSSSYDQRLQCDCTCHKPGASAWTGEHPDSAECKKRDWYAVETEIGRQPCEPDAPGAVEDISRLRFFRHHGFDGVYGHMGTKCDACGSAVEDEVYSTVITQNDEEGDPEIIRFQYGGIATEEFLQRAIGDAFKSGLAAINLSIHSADGFAFCFQVSALRTRGGQGCSHPGAEAD